MNGRELRLFKAALAKILAAKLPEVVNDIKVTARHVNEDKYFLVFAQPPQGNPTTFEVTVKEFR